MRKIKTIIGCALLLAIAVSLCVSPVSANKSLPRETNSFTKDYYIEATNQSEPFFDVVLPRISKNIKESNTHSVTPYYDKLPVANNPENFQGLGSTTYANINGKTVTAEAFYRVKGDSLHDPNYGMGLLIYQCIQYKRMHPEEDVKITFSSYRTSVTAAVCVIPESKYYGYMRSLYGTNYDEQGFVRISYMLVEAARMGIEVTLVNQLPTYSVQQYNPSTKKLAARRPLDYRTYFTKALETDCYNSYAKGNKVSDYMNFCVVGWTVGDKTGDMQHLKSCTVSHYLATDGTEHTNAIFFTSSNLDENDYRGCNGNGLAQSGVIISDHDDLYRVTYNYTMLMYKYQDQEDMFTLRKLVNERNVQQAELLRSGRGNMIPAHEQIVYVGSETDKVFELYFTPLGGSAETWDLVNNPIAKYVDKLPRSEDYVEFVFNVYGSGVCHLTEVMEKMVEKAFCQNPNPQNKIFLRVPNFDATAIKKLNLGTQIGARDIVDGVTVHSKDLIMSYVENGTRHRVSILTSCNYYTIAFSYRTNSILVINETDETGGNFYNIYGAKYTNGMLKEELLVSPGKLDLEPGQTMNMDVHYTGGKTLTWRSSDETVATATNGTIKALKAGTAYITVTDGIYAKSVTVQVSNCAQCNKGYDGLHCDTSQQYHLTQKLNTVPLTFEAEFTVNKDSLSSVNTLLGMDDNFSLGWAFTLNAKGQPRVMIRNQAGNATQAVYVFKNVNVATGQRVHLSIVTDFAAQKMYCYVNGQLAQTISKIAKASAFTEAYLPVVGGDYRSGNATYFPGTIHSIAAWSDMRSKTEIVSDYKGNLATSDSKLLVAYDFDRCPDCRMTDLSAKKNNLNTLKLWQTKAQVVPANNFAYSFAVVGDTQTMCESDPAAMDRIYDWLLANQASHKIRYVIGLGDITDDSTDAEWTAATRSIGKLNGKIPYSLCRGNHDHWDDFNRAFHNGFYENSVEGMMVSGDVDLKDPNQPGLKDGMVPEGGIVQGDLTNSYRCIKIGSTDYLIMTLDFAPNTATLQWANDVIEAHPNHLVIATTHAYMYRDGSTIDDGDCYPPTYYSNYDDPQNGDDMWQKCFSQHKNVLMVISGHDPWQHIVYRQDKGVDGNTVTQILVDPQYMDRYIGSTGMVAMLYFSVDGKTVTVRYYSVEKDCYGSELSQFTLNIR